MANELKPCPYWMDELRKILREDMENLQNLRILTCVEEFYRNSLNTRPAAPVEGLVTVGYVTTSPTGAEVFQRKPLVPGHGQFGYKQDAVVTCSQAAELLAAERAETMRQVKHWSELYKQQHYRAEKAEAIIAAERQAQQRLLDIIEEVNTDKAALQSDNAALTARVNELETERYKLAYAITGGEDAPGYLDSLSVETLAEVARDNTRRWFAETDRAEALETQLAAARNALKGLRDKGRKVLDVLKAWEDDSDLINSGKIVADFRAALEDRP